MKYVIFLTMALIVAACAQPIEDRAMKKMPEHDYDDVEVVRNEMQMDDEGGFERVMELSNGVIEMVEARMMDVDGVDEDGRAQKVRVMVQKGKYGSKDPETGKMMMVEYVADQNGFRAIGDHLPSMAGAKNMVR